MLFSKKKTDNPYLERLKAYQRKLEERYPKWKRNYLFYINKQWVSVDGSGEIKDARDIPGIDRYFKFKVKGNRLLGDVYAIIASMMQSRPTITAIPKTASEDDKEKAVYTTKFLNSFFYEQGLFGDKYEWLLLKGILYGTPALYVGYERTYYVEDYDDNGEPIYRLRYVVKPLTPFDFVVDPDIEDWEDQTEVFYLKALPKNIAEKIYPNIAGMNEYSFEKYVKDNNRVVTIIEYYRRAMGRGDKGKLIRMASDGTVLYEGDNPYGENLPIIYGQYYKVPGQAYGRSPVDSGKVWESVRNIVWSLMLQNLMIAGNYIAIAPDGAFNEDVAIEPGSILTYDPTVTGQNNIPKFIQGQGITSGWENAYSHITQEYYDALQIHDIYYGRAPASASGKARELTRAYLDWLKYPSQIAFSHLFTRMAKNVLYDVQRDVFKYWDRKEIMKYLGDDDVVVVEEFKKNKVGAGDIEVKIGKDLPYSRQEFTELIFQNALQRLAQDPKDWEAKKTVEEFYKKMGIGYLVVDRSKDEKMAKWENKVILNELSKLDLEGFEDLLKLDMSDDRAKVLANEWIQAHKKDLAKLEDIVEKITPKDWDDHKIHLQIHYDIVKSPEFYELPTWLRHIVIEMINQHRAMAGGVFSEEGSIVQKVLQKAIAPYVQPKAKQNPIPETGGVENAGQGQSPQIG